MLDESAAALNLEFSRVTQWLIRLICLDRMDKQSSTAPITAAFDTTKAGVYANTP